MALHTVVWISVTLFMVHEFEEIVFIRPWLARHRDDPRVRRHGFWRFRDTSTSTIATMIFEEYVIVVVVAIVATLADQPALFAGLLIPHALHLVGHITDAARLRMRTPSLLSSIATLPWCVVAAVDLVRRSGSGLAVALWTVALTAVIVANFALIYRLQPVIERRLYPAGVPAH